MARCFYFKWLTSSKVDLTFEYDEVSRQVYSAILKEMNICENDFSGSVSGLYI